MGAIRPQIVLFGDSLTENGNSMDPGPGWAISLTTHYNRKADVVHRGFGGYNTRMALLLLDKILPLPSASPPLLVTVFFGANDASVPNTAHGMVHVPLPEYFENTKKIVAHLKKLSDSTEIVLITPPPIADELLSKSAPVVFQDTSGIPTRRNEVTKLYAAECIKVGQEANVPVLDLWSIMQKTPGWEDKYFSDGLHLTGEGNAKVFEELMKILEGPGLSSRLKADQIRLDFPHYMDFGDDPMGVLEKSISQNTT